MNTMKKRKILGVTLALGMVLSGGLVHASNVTKNLKAVYSDIFISYNGQVKTLSVEPFNVDGTVYVPLRAIGEVMGSSVSWANNTVYITDQTTSTVSYEQEIATKNFEIASLKQQLEIATSELEVYKEGTTTSSSSSNLTSSAVKTTLSDIVYDYEDKYGIDWDFDLSIVSSRLNLNVYYSSRYDDVLDETTLAKRKAFIKAICEDIADSHDGVEIRGTLEDSYKDKEIASFKYSTSGTFTYEEDDDEYSLSELETYLENRYDEIDCFDFDIDIKSIELEADDDTLMVTLYTDIEDDEDYWNDLTSSDEDDLADFFEDIIDDIEAKTSTYDTIKCYIEDDTYGNIAIYRNGYAIIYSAD